MERTWQYEQPKRVEPEYFVLEDLLLQQQLCFSSCRPPFLNFFVLKELNKNIAYASSQSKGDCIVKFTLRCQIPDLYLWLREKVRHATSDRRCPALYRQLIVLLVKSEDGLV